MEQSSNTRSLAELVDFVLPLRHARFAAKRALVERALAPAADDFALDAYLRVEDLSLRATARELPPVFSSI